MSINILRVGNNCLLGKEVDDTAKFISNTFFKHNISVHNSFNVTDKIDNIKSAVNFLIDEGDALVITYDFFAFDTLKQAVCEICNTKLDVNIFAKNAIQNYYKNLNQPLTKQALENQKLPLNSRAILNTLSDYPGFIFTYNNKEVFVIPSSVTEAKLMFKNSVLPIILKMFELNYYSIIIKTFTLTEKEIKELLGNSIINRNKIFVEVFSSGFVGEIIIRYRDSASKQVVDNLISIIYEKLGRFIFTDEDTQLEDIVCDILKVQKKKLILIEDYTSGKVTERLVSSKNFEDEMLANSLIIYTNESKKRIGLDLTDKEENIIQNLTKKFLDANTVVVGNIKSKLENNVYYIGIGINENIETYKIKIVGEAEDVKNKLIQTTFFYLIKKLKQKQF